MKKQLPPKAIVLAVTGSLGSGKSSVARILKGLGLAVLDADAIAHDCIKPRKPAYRKIVSLFGKEVLKKDRSIDRSKLGKQVFRDGLLLKRLNSIVHPWVIEVIKKEIRKARLRNKPIVLDVPLLVEAGLDRLVDKIIVVKASAETQLRRVAKKTKLSRREIKIRIKTQIPLRAKMRLADFIIDNSGTRESTRKQVEKVVRRLIPNP